MVTLMNFFRSLINFIKVIIEALSDLGLKIPGAEKLSDIDGALDSAEGKIDELF